MLIRRVKKNSILRCSPGEMLSGKQEMGEGHKWNIMLGLCPLQNQRLFLSLKLKNILFLFFKMKTMAFSSDCLAPVIRTQSLCYAPLRPALFLPPAVLRA